MRGPGTHAAKLAAQRLAAQRIANSTVREIQKRHRKDIEEHRQNLSRLYDLPLIPMLPPSKPEESAQLSQELALTLQTILAPTNALLLIHDEKRARGAVLRCIPVLQEWAQKAARAQLLFSVAREHTPPPRIIEWLWEYRPEDQHDQPDPYMRALRLIWRSTLPQRNENNPRDSTDIISRKLLWQKRTRMDATMCGGACSMLLSPPEITEIMEQVAHYSYDDLPLGSFFINEATSMATLRNSWQLQEWLNQPWNIRRWQEYRAGTRLCRELQQLSNKQDLIQIRR